MLAGDGTAGDVGTDWQHVGSMPFMSYDISSPPEADDARVRRAGPDDLAAVTSLMADAFGLDPAIAATAAGSVRNPRDAACFFLVEDNDQPVSTCFASVVDDAVCIWCMSTPERFARRGYGRTLLGHCLAEAHRLGARLGLLGATLAGQPLYEATGWTILEPWQLYLKAATSAQFSG
jgi:GNAT superfamily N-acetyltransferase